MCCNFILLNSMVFTSPITIRDLIFRFSVNNLIINAKTAEPELRAGVPYIVHGWTAYVVNCGFVLKPQL